MFFPLSMGLICLAAVSLLVATSPGLGGSPRAGFLLAAACQLWVSVQLILGRSGLVNVTLLGLAILCTLPLPDVAGSPIRFPNDLVLVAYCLCCAMTFRPPAVATCLAPAFCAYVFLQPGAHGGDVLLTSLDTLVLNACTVVACSAFGASMVNAARSADRSAAAAVAAELDLERKETEAAAADAVRRVLHDDVLSALRAVSELPLEDAALVRRACREAVRSVATFEGADA